MKNTHLLPSNVSNYKSGLYIDSENNMERYKRIKEIGGKSYQLYITSNEKIENKNYVLSDSSIAVLYLDGLVNTAEMLAEGQWKKIILATDPLLVEHGVQAIDDEFLNWFVENSDCESIEVEKLYRKERNDTGMIGSPMSFTVFDKHRIIIPEKEEQKQHIIEMMQNDEELGLYGANIIDTWLEKNGDPKIEKQVEREAEQLELEEASLIFTRLPKLSTVRDGFRAGANWMAERMYSEDDCYKTLHNLMTDIKLQGVVINDDIDLKKWFENNKK